MQHKLPPIPVRILILVIIGALVFFGFRSLNQNESDSITASGSIEAVIVNISPEIAGKVIDVNAREGDSIKKDSPLLSLDPNLLTAQQAVAQSQLDSANAALASAQLKYDQTLEAALAAQSAQRAKDWQTSAPSEFDQANWYIDQANQITAAQTELENAKASIDQANDALTDAINNLNNSEYVNAEQRLAEARAAFLIADSVKTQADRASQSGGLSDAANDYYEDALDELNAAQEAYNDLLDTDSAGDIEYARGQVLVAQQRYDAAYARLLTLQTGEYSPAVLSAAQALNQAKTTVEQAEASLSLIEAQLSKLNIAAPIDGVILTRNVEPGEFIQTGGTALTMADLNQITITVYVPENLYGQISLGQTASVKVDSFPDETFNATVIWISNQAEFTPRNVQTVEGRSATFYAIKLSVDNVDGKLKIGMPADVIFGE
ncbi:MAG: efflux RND transporter periplasmic adaptor subunit [Anaerolineales bacterium]|nr:efflux RND transporter periplasmic adaptor subunit [Anaerolineales bacterium]